jgi:hypothetical protein
VTRQPHLPGLRPGIASIRYDHARAYLVTIAEYRMTDNGTEYTGREWICDTSEKPVAQWLRELGLVMVPF